MEIPDPLGMRQIGGDIQAAIHAIGEIPELIPALKQLGDLGASMERIASFDKTLGEIAAIVPALEELSKLGNVLDDLAKVGPSLERLANLDDVFSQLLSILEPLSNLSGIVPVLERLNETMISLGGDLGSVSETLAPLQNTTQRVGRVVDRITSRRLPKEFENQ
ncbi:MAG: hypothetical protein HKL80_10920 [Acidimicrobiales bacterium]|nr:hypothetical protein [Acidimicrobiales bacterium]